MGVRSLAEYHNGFLHVVVHDIHTELVQLVFLPGQPSIEKLVEVVVRKKYTRYSFVEGSNSGCVRYLVHPDRP